MLFRLFTILAVAALAVSTWILTSPGNGPRVSEDRSELPGYFLKNAIMTEYDDNGLPGVRLRAERIDQVANSNDIAMSNVTVNYTPDTGEAWVMVGDTAHVDPGTKVVHVQGNVKLQGDPTAIGKGKAVATPVIRTDALSYSVNDSVVTAPGDVRMDFGKHSLTGHGLKGNLKEQTLRLESKVNGRFYP